MRPRTLRSGSCVPPFPAALAWDWPACCCSSPAWWGGAEGLQQKGLSRRGSSRRGEGRGARGEGGGARGEGRGARKKKDLLPSPLAPRPSPLLLEPLCRIPSAGAPLLLVLLWLGGAGLGCLWLPAGLRTWPAARSSPARWWLCGDLVPPCALPTTAAEPRLVACRERGPPVVVMVGVLARVRTGWATGRLLRLEKRSGRRDRRSVETLASGPEVGRDCGRRIGPSTSSPRPRRRTRPCW